MSSVIQESCSGKKVFFLISLPFNIPEQKYYPAAYVAGIIASAGWHCEYEDYNYPLYQRSSEGMKAAWGHVYESLFEDESFSALQKEFVGILKSTLYKKIMDCRVDMVGISTSMYGRRFVELFMEVYRSLPVQPPIVYGGTDAFPIYYGKRYFNGPNVPDLMLQGEAEVALPKLLLHYEKTNEIKTSLPGFVYKNDEGKVVDNGMPEAPNLAECEIIADFSIFDTEKYFYEGRATSFTSKSCTLKCAFCDAWMSSKIRFRNYDAIVEEIKAQVSLEEGRRSVSFRDPNLNTTVKHMRNLSAALTKANLGMTWGGMGCFMVDLSDEVIDEMYASGFRNMMIGLESASTEIIENMGKHFDINKAQDMIGRLTKKRIWVRLPLISGFPGETVNDALSTIAFVLKHRKNPYVRISFSNRCQLHEMTFINAYPRDFFVDESTRSPDEWKSIDGSNNYDVRDFRAKVLSLLAEGKMNLEYQGRKNLEEFDFDSPVLALEVAELIYKLGMLTDKLEDSRRLIQGGVVDDDRKVGLSHWFSINKSGKKQKEIIDFLLICLDSLGDIIDQEPFLDIDYFRKKLFRLDDYLEGGEGGFELVAVRKTVYDSGRHAMFWGNAYDPKGSRGVEGVYAIAGDKIVEFSHGIPTVTKGSMSAQEGGGRGLPGNSGFSGKASKFYYEKTGMRFVVVYDDLTKSSWDYSPEQIDGLVNMVLTATERGGLEQGVQSRHLKAALPLFHAPIDLHKLCVDQPYGEKGYFNYSLGRKIDLNDQETAFQYLWTGFGNSARHGANIMAPEVILGFWLDGIPSSDVELVVESFVDDEVLDGNGSISFKADCNGFPLDDVHIGSKGEHGFALHIKREFIDVKGLCKITLRVAPEIDALDFARGSIRFGCISLEEHSVPGSRHR